MDMRFKLKLADELLETLVIILFIVAHAAHDQAEDIRLVFCAEVDGPDKGFIILQFRDAPDRCDDKFSIEPELRLEFVDPIAIQRFGIELGWVDAGVDYIDAGICGFIVLLDIVLDRVADADDPVALGHDCAIFADAVESMHGGDERDVELFIGKPGQPGGNAAMGVENGGAEVGEQSSEGADAKRNGQRVFGAEVEGDVSSAIVFDLAGQRSSIRDNRGSMPAFDEFAVEAEDQGFNPSLV